MTKEEKQKIIDLPAIGYWTEFGGIEVKDIDFGIDDYIYCVSFASTSKPRVHYLKIKTTKSDRHYVILYGHPMYFDECLTV